MVEEHLFAVVYHDVLVTGLIVAVYLNDLRFFSEINQTLK